MKLVEFTRDMRPYVKGESRVVPDPVAEQLVADGDAVVRPSIFDEQPQEERPQRRRYQTRGLI